MHVTRLTAADAERFLQFRAEALANDPLTFRITPDDDAALGLPFWRERLTRDFVVAVIDDDGRWLGMGGLSQLVGSKLSHKALIWGMYVAPAARGSGAASRIIEALLEHARGRVRQVQLTVMADNERAQALYKRHGFVTYAIEPASVRRGDRFDDEALMWRLVD
jgi:ribosomal protein S18 acetylase RimI-like enzyme